MRFLQNTGVINLHNGTFSFCGSILGTINVHAGAAILLGASNTHGPGSILQGAGSFESNNGPNIFEGQFLLTGDEVRQ